MRLRLLHDTRVYSTLNGIAPKEARERYPTLIKISEDGSFTLTQDFQKEIDRATSQYETTLQNMAHQATQRRN